MEKESITSGIKRTETIKKKGIEVGKLFFTSDNHFGHERVIQFDGRPFSSVEEMDTEMIRRWNAKWVKGIWFMCLGT